MVDYKTPPEARTALSVYSKSEVDLIEASLDAVVTDVTGSKLVPLIVSENRALLWLDNGIVRGPGIQNTITPVKPRRSTDGASLHRWRTASAKVRSGVSGAKARIALIGDSWCEMPTITTALRDSLAVSLGLSGEGYRPASPGNVIGPATWSSVGWTIEDANVSSAFPNKAGPDGSAVITSGSSATMALTGVVATDVQIYRYQYGGTWRWKIDGGAWNVVVDNNTGNFGAVNISGLSDTAHTLLIDTVGNTGTVSMAGIYTTRAAAGAEVLKFGNGGITGYLMQSYIGYLTAPLAQMQPDIAVVIIGTNDIRSPLSPPNVYISALSQIVTACRAAVPDIGFVFVIPPMTNTASPSVPLSQYRDDLQVWTAANGHEMIDLLGSWPSYATAFAGGLFVDDFHVTPLGASVLVADLFKNLLGDK